MDPSRFLENRQSHNGVTIAIFHILYLNDNASVLKKAIRKRYQTVQNK